MSAVPDLGACYARVPTLVVGGAGFIGRRVVRALAAAGATVYATSRTERPIPEARTVAVDLARPDAIRGVVAAAQPAIVFNAAGYGVDRTERDADLMHALNARLVADICDAIAGVRGGAWTGMRLVHVGSALECAATTPYGRSKAEGSRHVSAAGASGIACVVARAFNVYGPGEQAGRLLPTLCEAARTGGVARLTSGEQRRDFVFADDVAEGLLRLGVSDASFGESVNLATGRLTSVREFAETAASILGLTANALAFGAMPTPADELRHGDVDISRLQALTSWLPAISVADGIRRTVECHDPA